MGSPMQIGRDVQPLEDPLQAFALFLAAITYHGVQISRPLWLDLVLRLSIGPRPLLQLKLLGSLSFYVT